MVEGLPSGITELEVRALYGTWESASGGGLPKPIRVDMVGPGRAGLSRRREFCHFPDTPLFAPVLKPLPKGEGSAAG